MKNEGLLNPSPLLTIAQLAKGFGLGLVAFCIYLPLLGVLPSNVNFNYFLTVVINLLVMLYLWRKEPLKLALSVEHVKIVAIGIIFIFLKIGLYVALSKGSNSVQYETSQLLRTNGGWPFVVYVAFTIIIIPFQEEVIFRGYCYRVIKARYGISLALLVSILMFLLVHIGISGSIISILIQGFLYTYIYDKSESVIASWAVHSLHNLLLLCASLSISRPFY